MGSSTPRLSTSSTTRHAQGTISDFTLAPKDPEYPYLLRMISTPPTLYVRGHLPPDLRGVACVGTRKPSRWGRVVTERITRLLVEHGYSIISGLALGLDAVAHQTALDMGGHTVAVLPCSLDLLYPRCHRDLADRILANGGALVSPFAPGSQISRSSFVRRNRIQSGLSLATLIMQCTTKSGTMHTARFTREQRRLLCVARPSDRYAEEPQSQGNLSLLREPGTLGLQGASDYPQMLHQLRELVLSS